MKSTTLILAAWYSFSAAACRNSQPTLSLLYGKATRSFLSTCTSRFLTTAKVVPLHGSSDEWWPNSRRRAANYGRYLASSDVAASSVKDGLAAPHRSLQNSLYGSYRPALAILLGQSKTTRFSDTVMWETDFTALRQQLCGGGGRGVGVGVVRSRPDSWNVYGIPKSAAKISLWDELAASTGAPFSVTNSPTPPALQSLRRPARGQ